jgi:hypothetical protein
VQPWIVKRNVFPVTATPEFQIVIQEQITQHANGEGRRRTGNEDSHHFRLWHTSLQPDWNT